MAALLQCNLFCHSSRVSSFIWSELAYHRIFISARKGVEGEGAATSFPFKGQSQKWHVSLLLKSQRQHMQLRMGKKMPSLFWASVRPAKNQRFYCYSRRTSGCWRTISRLCLPPSLTIENVTTENNFLSVQTSYSVSSLELCLGER